MIVKETEKYQKYIQVLATCAEACYECFNACLDEEKAEAPSIKRCIKLLVECAKICETTAFIMSMDGKFVKRQSELCAEVCDVCSQTCALFQDEPCQKCALECRKCSELCTEMTTKT
jgi:hypothetical protein